MKLELKKIPLKDIKLDAENPRYMDIVGSSQDEIQKHILNQKSTKDLMKSLKKGIKWINQIIVREDPGADGSYIVVEGNSRIACLKSGQINDYVDENKTVPVLLAERTGDSTEEFFEELRRLQGIANVLVVKQWKKAAKARHLSKMFWDKKDKGMQKNKAVTEVAKSIGESNNEIRVSVIRYAFYEQIMILSTPLDERQYSYLEAITKNETVRSFYGFNNDTYKFIWKGIEEEDYDEEIDRKMERLKNTSEFISGISTGKLRDNINNIIKGEEDDGIFNQICSGEITWAEALRGPDPKEEIEDEEENVDEEWVLEIESFRQKLIKFPLMYEWENLPTIKENLKSLKGKIDEILDHYGDDD